MTSLSPVLALLHLVWSQQPDSLTTLRAARRAQATFEAIRRQHLPYGSGHAGGTCDLRIGRFCYWYDDDRQPPEHAAAEPQLIRDARATLLAALDDAGARLPGDEWIAGQRVRYLVEAGRDRAAVGAARECRADGWWCAALLSLARIGQTSGTAYGLGWGDDLRELLLRFGWPTYWTREASPSVTAPEPLIVGHDPTPAFHFFPSARAFDAPADATSDDWTLAASHAPEGYAPAYADTFQQLEDQTAMFRRGDSCLVVAAYDLSDYALFGHQAAQAALVVARDEHSRWVAQHPARSDGPDVLTLSASCDAQLLSLEIVAPGARRVARVRHGIRAGGTSGSGPAGLDVLLFDAPDSLPGELSAVLSHVLGTTRVRADRKLGLFWELYGVTSPAGPVSASLAVTPLGVGWLRRTVEALGLASHTATMRLNWDEGSATRAGDVAVASRALAVDLSALSPGRYRIELTVKAPGQEPATARREIEVVRPERASV